MTAEIRNELLAGGTSTAGRKFVPVLGVPPLSRFEERQQARVDEQFERAGRARRASDQAEPFELQDHLVNRRRSHLEEGLHVRLGRRPAVDRAVGVDEGEVLALQGREPARRRRVGGLAWHAGQSTRRVVRARRRIALRRSSGTGAPRRDSSAG